MPKQLRAIVAGDKFGKLTVIEKVGYKIGVSRINYYKCLCECGNYKGIRRNHLLMGLTISCGCVQKTTRQKPPGEASYSILYTICNRSAKKRGLEFSLTPEEHRDLVTRNCVYCDGRPALFNPYVGTSGGRKSPVLNPNRASIFVNGVDRVDSAKGYTASNCVPCCKNCNRSKWELSAPDFIAHVRAIVEYQDKLLRAA